LFDCLFGSEYADGHYWGNKFINCCHSSFKYFMFFA
jgi:hypothetical protein